MNLTKKIKKEILRTPFAKFAKNIQARLLVAQMPPLQSKVKRKTVYCISPYKTGTTYLASCFSPEIAKHEPLHHLSLKKLDENFDSFFVRRMNHLDLKLECSGFLSAYITELSENTIAKDLEYICILRPPSAWVTSAINHWNQPKSNQFKFEYTLELFWKNKVGVNLHEFQIGRDTAKNREIINTLVNFYFDFTKNTRYLKNLKYIWLNEIDDELPLVESLIDETTRVENRRKRKSKYKPFTFKNSLIDAEYRLLTEELISGRMSLSY